MVPCWLTCQSEHLRTGRSGSRSFRLSGVPQRFSATTRRLLESACMTGRAWAGCFVVARRAQSPWPVCHVPQWLIDACGQTRRQQSTQKEIVMPARNRKYRTGAQASSGSVPAPCAHHTSAGYEVGMRRAVCLLVGWSGLSIPRPRPVARQGVSNKRWCRGFQHADEAVIGQRPSSPWLDRQAGLIRVVGFTGSQVFL